MSRKTLVFCLMAVLSVILVIVWSGTVPGQHNSANTVNALTLTADILKKIDVAVTPATGIVGIQVQSIDFQRNIRVDTYTKINNPYLQEIYSKYINNKTVDTLLFSEHKDYNTRIIRLINGEFICVPYALSAARRDMPDAEKYVNTICALGIPPYHFSNFAGILILYLYKEPTKIELDNLFLFARDISTEIANTNPTLSIR